MEGTSEIHLQIRATVGFWQRGPSRDHSRGFRDPYPPPDMRCEENLQVYRLKHMLPLFPIYLQQMLPTVY